METSTQHKLPPRHSTRPSCLREVFLEACGRFYFLRRRVKQRLLREHEAPGFPGAQGSAARFEKSRRYVAISRQAGEDSNGRYLKGSANEKSRTRKYSSSVYHRIVHATGIGAETKVRSGADAAFSEFMDRGSVLIKSTP